MGVPLKASSIRSRAAAIGHSWGAARLLTYATAWALGLCFASVAGAQISPGPLARAHQSLNGDANCTKCHLVSTKAPTFRCLECHQEISVELRFQKGLHATYQQGGPQGSACVKCHSDHNGETFNMLHWDPTHKGFDHSKTGYVLDGKHATTNCRDCHNASHIPAASKALLNTKDLNHTYLGLSST